MKRILAILVFIFSIYMSSSLLLRGVPKPAEIPVQVQTPLIKRMHEQVQVQAPTQANQESFMCEKFEPIKKLSDHLVGFHIYSDDHNRQIMAHHYCSTINEDIIQCIIYDSDQPNAKLMGVEYIFSEKLFKTLPEEERKFWHSHVYEVKSGLLVATNISSTMEKTAMKALISTYGKTFHFWQMDKEDSLPLGVPDLMMAIIEDGQIHPELVAERDRLMGVNTTMKKLERQDIEVPLIISGADQWSQTGLATILESKEVPLKNEGE